MKQPYKIKRLGSEDPEDQVRQAVASVRLSGLKPSTRAIELVRSVAKGEIAPDAAVEKMRGWYKARKRLTMTVVSAQSGHSGCRVNRPNTACG